MKRYGNLFQKIVDPSNIYLGYRLARKGKTWQDTIKIFEDNLENNLENIYNSLVNHTFTTSRYETFTIYEPKRRLIYKLPFNPDRIVQHAVMNIVEPIWESFFIHDSYACRKGKGIHAGSKRTMEFIRKVGKGGYCLKMDISKFYPSINHDILFNIIERKIKCHDTLNLLEDIIYSIKDGYNVPVGNYTSQWLGNLYLNELDQFAKCELKVQHYIRYCDDFIFFHQDKRFLHSVAASIEDFLADTLNLKLSKNRVFPIRQGIDFLGYRHFPNYILLRKSAAQRIKRRVKKLPQLLGSKNISPLQFQSSIASTKGWLKWCNSFHLSQMLNFDQLSVNCHA